MSFGVGIGDICLVLDGIITICKSAGETRQILQAAQRDVLMLQSTVLLLRDEIGDERLFVKNGATEVSTIRSSLRPLRNDVKEIQDMLRSYTSPAPTFLNKVRYATLDKNRFDDLREKFTGHRINIIVILNLIISKRQKGQTNILHDIKDNQTKNSSKQQEELKKLRKSLENNGEKTSQSLEEILQLLKGDLSQPKASSKLDASSILRQMEEHLAAKGVTGEAARIQLLPLRSAIDGILKVGTELPATSPKISPSQPARKTSSRQNRLATPPSSPRPASRSSDRSQIGLTEDSRILCVDRNHGNISILAQAFLEIARVRLAYGNGQWIFKRVDSKGLSINQSRDRPPKPTVPSSVVSDIDKTRYPWAVDYPNEISRIVDRQKSQTRSKLTLEDFKMYTYIFCFTEADADMVRALRADAAVLYPQLLDYNVVKLIRMPDDDSGGEYLSSLNDKRLITAMRDLIENFINEDISEWYRRTKVPEGQRFRTLQFVIDMHDMSRATGADKHALTEIPRVKEWEKATCCSIKITKLAQDDPSAGNQCLISVIGPRGSNVGVSQSGMNSVLHQVEKLFREEA